jgi:hypothetical protein
VFTLPLYWLGSKFPDLPYRPVIDLPENLEIQRFLMPAPPDDQSVGRRNLPEIIDAEPPTEISALFVLARLDTVAEARKTLFGLIVEMTEIPCNHDENSSESVVEKICSISPYSRSDTLSTPEKN